MNRFQFPITKKSTKVEDAGGYKISYLEKHKCDCGIGALSMFHLQSVGKGKYKYDYKCIMPKNCLNNKYCVSKTESIDKKKCKLKLSNKERIMLNGKHVDKLKELKLMCGTNEVMTSFQFKMSKKTLGVMHFVPQIWYEYRCCPAKVKDVKTMKTSLSKFSDFGTNFLDRQLVQVPDTSKQAFVGFNLKVDYSKKGYQYEAKYCTITG